MRAREAMTIALAEMERATVLLAAAREKYGEAYKEVHRATARGGQLQKKL